jgi:hypothetical protein
MKKKKLTIDEKKDLVYKECIDFIRNMQIFNEDDIYGDDVMLASTTLIKDICNVVGYSDAPRSETDEDF